jgi:hypothetical protein
MDFTDAVTGISAFLNSAWTLTSGTADLVENVPMKFTV